MKSTTLSSIALLAFFALSKADEPSLSTHVTGPCDSDAFEAFLQQYGKGGNYGHSSTNEYKKRCGAFTLVKNAVDAHNADTNKSITLQLNEHSDLFPEERKARNGLKVDLDPTPSQPSDSARRRRLSQRLPERRNLQTLPTSVDYTTTDNSFGVVAVTDIKNQGQCGDCYTFAAAAVVEGQLALENGSSDMQSLSEQQITDCVYDDASSGNQNGCQGGFTNEALDYVEAYGISTLADYPQLSETKNTGTPGTCTAYSNYNSVSMATDYTPYATLTQKGYADSCDETAVMEYLDTYGPLGIAIIASSNGFQSYSSGIMTNADLGLSSETSSFTCSYNTDHAVTLVGYGTDNGQDYWLVKNSWGTSWGENGYFRAARGTGGCSTACITFMASWAYSTTVDPSNSDLTFDMDDDYTTLTPTTPSDSSDPSSTSSTSSTSAKMNGWETALLVIGCVAVAVGAVVGGYNYNKQNMKKRQEITQNFIQSQHNEI